jgi:hypothetical protein
MKINRLDAHDRFVHLKKGEFNIGETCQDIINKRPFGDRPFYIFAHKREIAIDERLSLFNQAYGIVPPMFNSLEDVPTHRLVWQPRLTRPKPQENSMLFKGYPGTDNVKVIWIIPQRELWPSFEKGKMTEDPMIWRFIHDFQFNPEILNQPDDDDLSDEEVDAVYKEISMEAKFNKWKNPQSEFKLIH